jgi:hypothetical protein
MLGELCSRWKALSLLDDSSGKALLLSIRARRLSALDCSYSMIYEHNIHGLVRANEDSHFNQVPDFGLDIRI